MVPNSLLKDTSYLVQQGDQNIRNMVYDSVTENHPFLLVLFEIKKTLLKSPILHFVILKLICFF